jgi:hypothetical protein
MKTRLARLACAAAGSLFALAAQAVPVINWVGTNAGGASIGGVEQICKNGDLACSPAPRDNAFFSGWFLAGGYLTLSEAATVTMSYWARKPASATSSCGPVRRCSPPAARSAWKAWAPAGSDWPRSPPAPT